MNQTLADLNDAETLATFSALQKGGISPIKTKAGPKPGRKKGDPNRTEAEFGLMLQKRLEAGEFSEFAYEPFALPVEGSDRGYTPDFCAIPTELAPFVNIEDLKCLANARAIDMMFDDRPRRIRNAVSTSSPKVMFFEIKGGQIWRHNLNRFKQARERYPWAVFEMWQKTKDGWNQIR